MYPKKISKEAINELPILAYEGPVTVVDTKEKLAAIQPLLSNCRVLGFDTETKPVFTKGKRNEVSLLQFAVPDMVYLVRIHLTEIPEWLLALFSSDAILKVGVGLRDDITDLKRIVKFQPQGFIDLAQEVQRVGIEELGLRKIAGILLKGRISKSAQTSNWENEVLTEKQIKYAATDAWACLEMYKLLNL